MIVFTLLATALAANPPGIIALDHVETFTLEKPATFWWNADQPTFTQGTIVVVEVAPAWALTRQTGGHVLYVGETPAARLNPGHIDGHIVAYVPGHIDLSKAPIFWGPATLPEQVHPAVEGADAVAAAAASPFSSAAIAAVEAPLLRLGDRKQLQHIAAALITLHAPSDGDFARGFQAPEQP